VLPHLHSRTLVFRRHWPEAPFHATNLRKRRSSPSMMHRQFLLHLESMGLRNSCKPGEIRTAHTRELLTHRPRCGRRRLPAFSLPFSQYAPRLKLSLWIMPRSQGKRRTLSSSFLGCHMLLLRALTLIPLSFTRLRSCLKYSTGNLRFAPPQAPSKISGTRQATTYGAGCLPLPGGFGGGGKSSEDCACAR